MEDWKEALDNSYVVGILSTDLSKAFDSLHPPLLLAKLKAYGFQDCAIGLVRSYFYERWNRVRIGTNTMSDWRKTERGCPQGSNFGPLMWNIFQNYPMYSIQTDKCSVMMYADNHQSYTLGKRIEDVESILNYEGKEIWYKDNLLMCNHEKFQSMSLGSRHKNKQMKIDVMNNDIESHTEMKLLGVTIDSSS